MYGCLCLANPENEISDKSVYLIIFMQKSHKNWTSSYRSPAQWFVILPPMAWYTHIYQRYSYCCVHATAKFVEVDKYLSWHFALPLYALAHRSTVKRCSVEFASSKVIRYLLISSRGEADQRPSCFLLITLPAEQSRAALEEHIIITAKKTFWTKPDLRDS